MVWTHAKTIAALAAAHAGAQELFTSPSDQPGTIIISSSTQYFTVTTGSPGGSPGSSQTETSAAGSSGGGSIAATATSGAFPTESALPSPDAFVIEIGAAADDLAIESGAPGPQKVRRQGSEFVGTAGASGGGGTNAVDCSRAARFVLVDGELTNGGQKVWADPDGPPARLVASPPPAGAAGMVLVTRTWQVVGGELIWVNASFADGQARFCLDAVVHGVFFTTTGEGDEPVGCAPVELTPLLGKPA